MFNAQKCAENSFSVSQKHAKGVRCQIIVAALAVQLGEYPNPSFVLKAGSPEITPNPPQFASTVQTAAARLNSQKKECGLCWRKTQDFNKIRLAF